MCCLSGSESVKKLCKSSGKIPSGKQVSRSRSESERNATGIKYSIRYFAIGLLTVTQNPAGSLTPFSVALKPSIFTTSRMAGNYTYSALNARRKKFLCDVRGYLTGDTMRQEWDKR